MISLENISRTFDNKKSWAVRKLSLSIRPGELMVLVGESGCGKTTTLKMINRLIEPTEGRIEIDGKNIAQHDPITLRRSIGYVIQSVGLFPHLTVGENIGLVPRLLGWSETDIEQRVEQLLEMLKLPGDQLRDRWPADLSGGQQQRVGLARALAARPSLMLMDEPFGALDPITRSGVIDEFKKIQKESGLTVILVTHDMAEALILADRLAIMQSGCLLGCGTPSDLIANPADPYIESLLATPQRQARQIEALSKTGERGGGE